MLFHIHVYINFINAIETIKRRLYVNKKHIKKYSISSSTSGTPSFPNNTLKVFNPHTTVPYTPAYIHKEKICKIILKCLKWFNPWKWKQMIQVSAPVPNTIFKSYNSRPLRLRYGKILKFFKTVQIFTRPLGRRNVFLVKGS